MLPVLQDTTCYHATQLNYAACTTGYNMLPCHSAELRCLYYRIQHATMPLSRTVLPVLQDTTCYRAQIGVQPLAVARRKVPLGGRRQLRAGRPSKSNFTMDYSYISSKKHRRVAPHNLGHCVEANISLGKTDSAT